MIKINPIIFTTKNRYLNIDAILITFCLLFTDFKILEIKISEILMLFFLIIKINLIPTRLRSILLVFFVFLVFTLIYTYFSKIYFPSGIQSFLKKPYIISLSRFAEYLSCIGFSLYVFLINKQQQHKDAISYVLNRVSLYSTLMGVIFSIEFFLLVLNLFPIENSIFFNEIYRLEGFYAEGGPLGLCYAFIASLTYIYDTSKYKWLKIGIMLFIIFLAQSKSGVVYVLLYFLFVFYKKFRFPKYLTPLIIIVEVLAVIIAVSIIAQKYIYEISNISSDITLRQNDNNYVMGRIAGLFIVPNIIKANFIFGIGMGNYPLVRNDPQYRGFFPEVDLWDSPGLGGLVDLFVEGGISFLILFAYFIWKLYNYSKCNNKIFLMLAFVLPLVLGVQFHFLYPWLIIGLLVNNGCSAKTI